MKLVGFGWKSDAFTVRGWCHGRRQGAHVRAPLLEDLHAEPPGSRQKVSMYRGTPARPHGSAPGALPQIGKLGTQHGGPGQAPEPPVTTAYLSLGPEMLPPSGVSSASVPRAWSRGVGRVCVVFEGPDTHLGGDGRAHLLLASRV